MSLQLAVSRSLTTSQQAFVEHLADGMDRSEAILAAGYSSADPDKEASRLLHTPYVLAAVQVGIARRMAIGAPIALKLLQDVVKSERFEPRLRVACAKDLLNRAGFIAPKAAEARAGAETPLNEMSMGELRDLADKLENELAGRAKEVTSASAAPRTTQAFDDIM